MGFEVCYGKVYLVFISQNNFNHFRQKNGDNCEFVHGPYYGPVVAKGLMIEKPKIHENYFRGRCLEVPFS